MKVFVSGSISLKVLRLQAIQHIDSIISNQDTVLIGDAFGVDKAVQHYLFERQYKLVIIYFSGDKIRNNIGDWITKHIPNKTGLKGKEMYQLKDDAMAHEADCGLMIWDGKSRGTKYDIENMKQLNKPFIIETQPCVGSQ